MKEIRQHLDWLLKSKLINCVQHAEATDIAVCRSIDRQFNNVGHNQREEFDR